MAADRRDDQPLVAVTGGAGFIGSHTVDLLVESGYQVVVLDDLSTGSRDNLRRWADDERVELVCTDISHGLFAPLAPVTARRGRVTRIVHLAAQTSVVHSIANPLVDTRVNYQGTVHVMEYARAMAVEHVVFASSAAVYGDVEELPVVEHGPTRPLSPYGIDKRASEMMLDYYAGVHGVGATAFRFFNVYGPRQDPSSPYSGVISIFVERATAGAPITIFGDGEQTRDFIYVGDIARAVVVACAAARPGYAVANLGTERETTVNRLANLVLDLCGSRSDVIHGPARAGEIVRSVASSARARALLAEGDEPYQVATTALRDGLARTIEWMNQP